MIRTKQKSVRKPRILITADDLEILETLVGRGSRSGAAAALLEEELSRAILVNETLSARPFCRIGSWVTYQDMGSGQVRNIQIVLPREADIDKRQVSVLSLVGASLLGLVAESEFDWTDDNGRPHRLRVLEVESERNANLA